MIDPPATIVSKPEDVTAVAISLKVEEELSLFALLATDGSTNRLGFRPTRWVRCCYSRSPWIILALRASI